MRYHGIDGVEDEFSAEGTYVNICNILSFQYIRDYVLTGEWPDARPGYEPAYTDDNGRKSEPLIDARMFYRDAIETIAVRRLANRTAADEQLAEAVIKESTKVVNTRDASAKMEWSNMKRRLREHKKRGTMLNLNYMEMIWKYHLYTITDFSFEPLD